jgi:hypothetical protein
MVIVLSAHTRELSSVETTFDISGVGPGEHR